MPTIYSPCDSDITPPSCDPCFGDIEHGRIRSVAFIHKSYIATLLANTSDDTVWQTGIADNSIFIIPDVLGTYDGGTPVEVTGYGDQSTRVSGYNHTSTYSDPAYKSNCAFYNTIRKSSSWYYAYRTESQTHITGSPVSIQPKAPITDDITADVVWSVDVKWSEDGVPCPFDTPDDVFVCTAQTS